MTPLWLSIAGILLAAVGLGALARWWWMRRAEPETPVERQDAEHESTEWLAPQQARALRERSARVRKGQR